MREGSRIASAFFLQHLSLVGMNPSTTAVPPRYHQPPLLYHTTVLKSRMDQIHAITIQAWTVEQYIKKQASS